MPSMTALLGFFSALVAIVILALLGVEGAAGWVVGVALVGWAIFAIRDGIRGRRAV
jgi:hypothetical protein